MVGHMLQILSLRNYLFCLFIMVEGIVLLSSTALAESNYDIVITNGRVIDPESQLDAIRNVGIRGKVIETISTKPLKGNRIIDAKGLIVSPGFIDIHSHSFELPGQRMQAFDGVTTALELESGVLPVSEWYELQKTEGRVLNYGTSASWTFARISSMVAEKNQMQATAEWYLDSFKYPQWQSQQSSEQELKNMLTVLEQGIKEGALAIGVNAGYVPGVGGKELIEVSKLAARYGIPTSTHIRNWSNVDPDSSLEGLNMMIGLAATTGVESIICHLNSSMLRDAKVAIEMLEAARNKGISITTEAYPYGMGSFPISAAILRLPGDDFRSRIGTDWDSVSLIATGRQIVDEADIRKEQKSDPGQMVVLEYLNEDKAEDLKILDQSIASRWIPIASDAVPWSMPDGSMLKGDIWPLPKEAASNPRSAGTFTKFLGEYVRERKVLSWMEALRKISLLPAQTLENGVPAMKRKGRLQEGMDADITIFDPKTIADRATVENSAQTSIGIRYLLVNGTPLIIDNKLDVKVRPGHAIRRDIK